MIKTIFIYFKKTILYFLLALLLIEATGYLLTALHIEPTGFKFFISNEWNDNANPYADRDSIVGVWHKPNDEWIQSGPCFTVKMRSNQYGARDNNWDTSKSGYLFLGSSLIEGYGIDYGKRISEIFEQLTHKEVFDCGMSGYFTPVQYYETLHKLKNVLKFDTCFVFFVLPLDELLANQPTTSRIRPYITDTGIYYVRSSADFPLIKTNRVKLNFFLLQYSYINHLLFYYKYRNVLKSRIVIEQQKPPEELYKSIRLVMHKFCKDYPDKFFYFVILPTLVESPLEVPSTNDANKRIIDMRHSLNMRTDFFQCNEHWNDSGHFKTAVALYDSVFKKSLHP